MQKYSFLIFLFSVAIYIIYGIFIKSDKVSNNTDFFTKTNPKLLWWSFLASNLTVSGSIIALLSFIGFYKIWILVVPISYIAGIFFYFFLSIRLLKIKNAEKDIFHNIDKYTSPNNTIYNFNFFFTLSTIIVVILALGWEFYVGSKFISLIILKEENLYYSFFVALFIAFIVIIYSYFRGYNAVVKTDKIQVLCSSAVLLALFLTLISHNEHINITKQTLFPAMAQSDLITFTLTMFLINTLYATYSVVNTNIIRSINYLKISYQKKTNLLKFTFFKGGSSLFIVWNIIIVLGFLINARPEQIILSATNIETILLLFGITAFFISTVDSNSFGIINLIDINFKKFHTKELKSKKALMPFITLISLSFTFFLMATEPNIFLSLMSISGNMIIWLPVLMMITINNKKINNFLLQSFSSTFTSIALMCCFILSCIIQFYVDQTYTFYIILSSFVFSVLILIIGYFFGRNYTKYNNDSL
jgi:hypothetical protein